MPEYARGLLRKKEAFGIRISFIYFYMDVFCVHVFIVDKRDNSFFAYNYTE